MSLRFYEDFFSLKRKNFLRNRTVPEISWLRFSLHTDIVNRSFTFCDIVIIFLNPQSETFFSQLATDKNLSFKRGKKLEIDYFRVIELIKGIIPQSEFLIERLREEWYQTLWKSIHLSLNYRLNIKKGIPFAKSAKAALYSLPFGVRALWRKKRNRIVNHVPIFVYFRA